MAKISTYPIISIPTLNDLLIGTDVENLNETKNFSLGDISGLIGQGFVPYVGATENVNLGLFSIEASSFIVDGGLASEFVKADGSLDSTVYVPETRTLTINGETYNLSADRSWDINSIDSLTTIGTSGAATYIGKVLNIPVYQPQGNYITQLSGEATGSGPGNASVTLDNTAVISKVLTGLNVTGGNVVDTDTILQAFGKVQNQINGLVGGVQYQGTWNAATNTPFLQSSVGVQGYYYVVSVAGNTNLNGITDWQLGDWAIYDGTAWQKVDNTDAVISVNGYVGAVVLTASDVGAVPTTRTLTINGVGYDLSLDRAWTVGDVRTDQSYINPSWIVSLDWGKITSTPTTLAGYGITDGALNTTTLTINGTTYDLTENRTWSVGTVTSIATTGPLTGGTITGSGTIGITQAGASSDGYLSSADWNAFNNKQEVISVTSPLTFAAGVVGITQSGAATDGYLSSTDWNTFNSKVGGSGTANTLPMWGSSSSLVNSPLSYAADTFNFQYNSATGGAVVFTNSNGAAYAYTIQMNNFGSPRSTVHGYTDGLVIQSIGGTQVSRMFANGNLILGTGFVDNGYKLEITGDLYVNTIVNAVTDTDKFLVSDGGVIKYRTGAEVLSDIGAQGALTLTTTGTTGAATLIGDVLNIPNYSTDLSGYVTLGTDQTITGLKTILRGGDVLNFKIGTDTLYGLKVAYNQNELVPSGEATWSFVNTFNNGSGTGLETTPISFFRGVLVTGQRLLSASINTNLLDYYSNNPSGRYPIYAYNTGVQQFASSIIVGETTGVVNAVTGAIADLPAGVVANFKGRVIGSNAVNNDEFVTLGQVTSTSRAAISLTTTGTSGPATYSSVTGVLNIPEYQGGVTSFNTRTGAVTLTSSDVTTALGFNPVTDARTLTINGVTYDLTANRSWTVGVNPSAREIQTYIATSGQTVFTVTGGYTVGLVDVYINGVRLTSSDFTATNGTTVVLTVGTMVGNIVDIIKYTSGLVTGISGTGTTNELAYFTGSTVIASLSTATYPSLTELSYVKGVTSSIQTQLNGKQNALTNPVTGTGTTNYLPKFTGSTTIGNSLVYDNGSTVLIGTTTAPTPVVGVSFPLSITSAQATRIRIDSSRGAPNYANAGVGLYASSVQKWSFAHYSTDSGANYDFTIYNDALTSSAILIKGSNSNVLIGSTTDNGAKLQVSGEVRISGVAEYLRSVQNSTLSQAQTWYAADGITRRAVFGFRSGGSDNFTLLNERNGSMFIGTNDATNLTITSSGNVGIGISNPNIYDSNADNLVIGSTGANDKNGITIVGGDTDGRGAIYFADTTQNSAGYITYLHSTNRLLFGTSDTTRLTIDSTGNLGLGVTPSAWLSVYRAFQIGVGGGISGRTDSGLEMQLLGNAYRNTSGNYIYSTTDKAARFVLDGDASFGWYNAPSGTAGNAISFTQAMTLTSGGNLLVGTFSDNGARLQVSGGGTTMATITSSSTASGLQLTNSGGTASSWIIQSDGGAVAGQAALRFYSLTASAYRMSIDGSGNVGIGTTSPSTLLHLNGTSTQITLQNVDGGTNAERIGMFMTSGDIFKILSLNDNNTTRVDNIITANVLSGNVGIGTPSPSNKLDIQSANGTTYAATPQLRVGGGGVNNSYAQILFSDNALSDGKISYFPAAAAENRFFSISARQTESDFVIRGSGNVGIGTTSPTRKLDITSTSEQLRLSYDTSGSVFTDFRSDSAGGLLINTSGGYIIQYIAGSPIMRMNANGNVLIGTTTDGGRKLEVQTGSTNAALWVQTGGTTSAYTIADFRTGTNLPALQILGNGVSYFGGNVGIGTASPTAKLDVSGSTSITGNLDLLAGGVGSGFNRQISIGSGTAYNYQLRADGDDFNIVEAGSTSRLRYDYGDVRWYITGGLTISGSLSKGSGSFKIDHPLPEKKDTHHLVHSFVEAPQADNIYRGKIDLVDGFGEVNIDEASGMSEGTFVLLNGNIQCFTSNEKGWTAIRGKVEGNILKIEAQDLKCNDTISWLVIGERIDQHMIDTDWTDENGKVIVEPLKKTNK
jgi:hypothetical protein